MARALEWGSRGRQFKSVRPDFIISNIKEVIVTYSGPERRKHPRISGRFVVSYRIIEDNYCTDVAQTKNISAGGMLLTTNRQFNSGTILALEIRLPFSPDAIKLVGKVLESQEVTKGLIYDTRIQFLEVDERRKKAIKDTVDYYLKKG